MVMPIRLLVVLRSATHVLTSSALVVRRFITAHLTRPLPLHLAYFLAVDLLGFLALALLRPSDPEHRTRFVDMLFMSTSAVTVTGLATARMEDLSGAQTVVLTFLMLLGSDMFVSLLALALGSRTPSRRRNKQLAVAGHGDRDGRVRSVVTGDDDEPNQEEANPPPTTTAADIDGHHGCHRRVRWLGLVVLAYMAVILVLGSALVFAYVARAPAARAVLARKRIGAALFAVSVTVSSFTNGGLLPTNESMAVFAADRGLLLLLAGHILAGNTMFPVFLRLVVWAVKRASQSLGWKQAPGSDEDGELEFMAKDAAAAGFPHLLPSWSRTAALAATVVAVAAAAAAVLCVMSWRSAVFAGLGAGDMVANAVFMAVNARQAGENSIDCSLLAPAVLIMLLAMMCMPASATFFSAHNGGGDDEAGCPGEAASKDGTHKKRRFSLNRSMLLSPLACVAAAAMLACVTERRNFSGDPVNFSTFNVIFEVVSAYGNVGLSTGYACSRLLIPEAEARACRDQPYSFSGWWSDQGKLLLALLMLCGRLKGFARKRRRS